ncbi:MAG: RadC family protein [Desulfomonilia bacterium]
MNESRAHYEGHRKRLRDRLRKSGRQALQDYELLEMLLAYGLPRKDTKPIAKRLLVRFGSFRQVLDAPNTEIEQENGIGEYASTLFILVKACMRRYLEPGEKDGSVLNSPERVLEYMRAEIGNREKEHFMLLCLNAAGAVIHKEIIAEGTVDLAHVYPREILKIVLEKNATSLILVHNHPSGSLNPSHHDESLTRTLSELCAQVGITVHDHLIVSRGGAYSIKLGGTISGDSSGS